MPIALIRRIFRDVSPKLDVMSAAIVRLMSRVSWHDSLSGPWHIADNQGDKSKVLENAISRSSNPKIKNMTLGQNITCFQ
jgi:hypothetical protein